MVKRFSGYFNIMARIIRKIFNAGKFSNKDFQSVLTDENDGRYIQLMQQVPQIVSAERRVNFLMRTDLTETFYSALENIVLQDDIFLLLLLLYFMDRAIEPYYKRSTSFEDDIEHFDALNINVADTGIIILRKVKCDWSHTQINKNLMGVLAEFYYIDSCQVPTFKIRNHIMDPLILSTGNRDSFKFAISPLTKDLMLRFSEPYIRKNERTGSDQYLFRVEEILSEETITEEVFSVITTAGKNKVDILVFPEMLGTERMLQNIRDRLRDCTEVPTLIVFPSIWVKTNDDLNNVNKSCLLLNGDEIIFEQNKFGEYSYLGKDGIRVYEDINRDRERPKEIHLLHIKGLGRICIIICYDYLEQENREEIVKNLCPTLICTPSFSTGNFDFQILAQSNFSRDCNWIWCNTCSAANHTLKEAEVPTIGIITQLSKKCDLSDSGAFQKNFKGKTLCEKEECDTCIYYAEIPIFKTS